MASQAYSPFISPLVPNVASEWLAFLLRIPEVSDSSLDPETGFSSHESFFLFSHPLGATAGLVSLRIHY
jgi:hypothetical protein